MNTIVLNFGGGDHLNPPTFRGGDGPGPFGGDGPTPLFGSPIAYSQIVSGTPIQEAAVTHIVTMELQFGTSMFVYFSGDTEVILESGAPDQLWSGLIIDPAPGNENLFLQDSMRTPFPVLNRAVSVSTTYGCNLGAGKHSIYWNLAPFGLGKMITGAGSLTAFASIGGVNQTRHESKLRNFNSESLRK